MMYVCDSASGGKFWSVSVSGSRITTHWGKMTDGQSKTKDFGTKEQATKEAEKLVKAKTKGGYVKAQPQKKRGKGKTKASDEPAPAAKKQKAAASCAKKTVKDEVKDEVKGEPPEAKKTKKKA